MLPNTRFKQFDGPPLLCFVLEPCREMHIVDAFRVDAASAIFNIVEIRKSIEFAFAKNERRHLPFFCQKCQSPIFSASSYRRT